MNTVECYGYRIPTWLFDFLEAKGFSVRPAAHICMLYSFVECNSEQELVSILTDVASGRLPLRYCGRQAKAEIAEKIGYQS